MKKYKYLLSVMLLFIMLSMLTFAACKNKNDIFAESVTLGEVVLSEVEFENSEKVKIENDFIYRDLEEQIKSIMGTKVSIHQKAKGKGKIEIEYYSGTELERIFDLLMSISAK